MNPLVLGDGILATELVKQTGWRFISRKKNKIDFTQPGSYSGLLKGCDVIVNCIACTDTYSTDKQAHWDVNYKGVAELVRLCNLYRSKLVHISTDYIYANSESHATEETIPQPVNTWYGHTKMLGDAHVQMAADNYLVIRESHKPYPFPYPFAWDDQVTNGDYVTVIARLIIQLVNTNKEGVYNVGTPDKTWYNLTKDEFNTQPNQSAPAVPKDITMNLTKLNNATKDINQ